MARRHHYARSSPRLQQMRQAALVNAAMPVAASNLAAATEAVDALNEAVGGDIGALVVTLTEVIEAAEETVDRVDAALVRIDAIEEALEMA